MWNLAFNEAANVVTMPSLAHRSAQNESLSARVDPVVSIVCTVRL